MWYCRGLCFFVLFEQGFAQIHISFVLPWTEDYISIFNTTTISLAKFQNNQISLILCPSCLNSGPGLCILIDFSPCFRWGKSVALCCDCLWEVLQGNVLIFIHIWYSWRESTLCLSWIQQGTVNIGNNAKLKAILHEQPKIFIEKLFIVASLKPQFLLKWYTICGCVLIINEPWVAGYLHRDISDQNNISDVMMRLNNVI